MSLTDVGTSVDALALFTYLRLITEHQGKEDLERKQYSRPALAFLRDYLEAQNPILGQIHVPFCKKRENEH
jgi:hypothetical protein